MAYGGQVDLTSVDALVEFSQQSRTARRLYYN